MKASGFRIGTAGKEPLPAGNQMVHHAANLPAKSTARRRCGLPAVAWRIPRGEPGFGLRANLFNLSKSLLAAMNFPLTTSLLLGYIVRR